MQQQAAKGRIHWFTAFSCSILDRVASIVMGLIAMSVAPVLATTPLLNSAPGMVLAAFLVLSTIISGWIAARIAKEERFLHGFLVGGIGIIMMLLDSLAGAQFRLENIVLQLIATALAGIAGYFSDRLPLRQRGK